MFQRQALVSGVSSTAAQLGTQDANILVARRNGSIGVEMRQGKLLSGSRYRFAGFDLSFSVPL